jgi:hypothetical protein
LNHFRMLTQTDKEIIFHGDIQKIKEKRRGKETEKSPLSNFLQKKMNSA